MEERIGKITKLSDETTIKGKPYKKIAFECEGRPQIHSLFLPSLIKLAKENAGKWVKITGEENEDGYWNVRSIEPVEAPEGVSPGEPSTVDRMTKDDWAAKDRRIVRQACVKAAVQLFPLGGENVAQEAIAVAKQFEAYVSDATPKASSVLKKIEQPTEGQPTRKQRLNEQASRLWEITADDGADAYGAWFREATSGVAWDDLVEQTQDTLIKLLKSKADKEGELVPSEERF